MNIQDAVRSRRVCFRQGEPSVVQDFRNPANGVKCAAAVLEDAIDAVKRLGAGK